uniref:hypothetical protein n=1 Tax=Herbidospora sakaeratensis TaxID=564415 RepID=UPI000783C059|nr:hypothetical protein [Herbidospora sakaeratensis]
MSGLDFFADLVTTGTVLGLDHTSTPAEVEEVFGEGPALDRPKDMIHSFGLIEFGWWRRRSRDPWQCVYFGPQAHRLPHLVEHGDVEPALTGRYGAFPTRLNFADLRAVVEARGFTLTEDVPINEGTAEYWEPTARMGILVQLDPEVWDEPPGTVLKILGPTRRNVYLRFQGRDQEFADHARHLLTRDETQIAAWLDRRESVADQDWWSHLRRTVAHHPADDPDWFRLRLTLDRQAAERGLDAPDLAAVTLIAALVERAETEGMDEAVTRWLAASPSLDEARGLAGRSPDEIRLARRLRSQIHVVRSALPLLKSADLAEEVRAWDELKPALLGAC